MNIFPERLEMGELDLSSNSPQGSAVKSTEPRNQYLEFLRIGRDLDRQAFTKGWVILNLKEKSQYLWLELMQLAI